MSAMLISLGISTYTPPATVAKPTRPNNPKPFARDQRNATEKADARYLVVMADGPKTTNELAAATGNLISSVQLAVRKMERRGVIEDHGRVKTGANPAILWGLPRAKSTP